MTQTRKWTVITAVVAVVILVLGFVLVVRPQHAKETSLRAQTTTQLQADQLLQTQIATLEQEQRNLPHEQQVLQRLATQLPTTDAEPALIRQLSSAADGAGVDLTSTTPGVASAVTTSSASGATTLGSVGTAGLMQIPLALAVTGDFPNIESFFQSLEKLPRAVLVSGFSLAPGTGDGLIASLTTAVFYSADATTSSTTGGTAATTTTTTGGTAAVPATS